MNYVVLEDERAPLFTNDIIKNVPNSSIVRITNKTLNTHLKVLDSKPLLSKQWLVFVEQNVSQNLIKNVLNKSACINIFYSTTDKYRLLQDYILTSGYKCSVVNMLNPSDEWVVRYICRTLHVEEDIALKIYKKSNKYLPYVEEGITILSLTGKKINDTVIQKYLPVRYSCNPSRLFLHYIGVKVSKLSDIVDYLYAFKFGYKSIKDKMIKMFEETITVYKLIAGNQLSIDNCEDFAKNHKEYKMSSYQLRRVVTQIYPSVSYEYLILLYKYLQDADNFLLFFNIMTRR